jgi:hypothetical protein
MAVRVLEVDAAAAIVMVDLAFLAPLWIGPIRETLLLDPAENHVELRLAHEEREMTRRDVALPVHEVEIDPVGGRDDLERPPFASGRQTEDAREKIHRHFAVVGPDDGVVELHGHESIPIRRHFSDSQSGG